MRIVEPPNAGYEVAYPRDPVHRPVVIEDGARAVFGYGERIPDGSYPGVIEVAVGTPALAANPSGRPRVHGRTLDELVESYLAVERENPDVRSAFGVDGKLGVMLDFDARARDLATRSVALFVSGGRAFVVTAVGFDSMFPDVRNAANAGLVRFLAGFRFTTPLFVSPALGFQVPLPIDAAPRGLRGPAGDERPGGAVVFGDGAIGPDGSSHAISVAVGSREMPALVQVLPGGELPSVERIWARSLAELHAKYVQALGGPTGSTTAIQLDGEPAMLVERRAGRAPVVLAVHGGRVYIITTSGAGRAEPAPGFDDFIEAFAFLDVPAAG